VRHGDGWKLFLRLSVNRDQDPEMEQRKLGMVETGISFDDS
jgi:hypothetical protein